MSFRDRDPMLLILLDFIIDRGTCFVDASEQARIAELRGELCEALRRPLPLELLDARKQRRVRAQRRKPLEQQRKLPALAQNFGRKLFDGAVAVDEPRCALRADTGQAGITI